jgi:hypothetical protein
MGALHIILKVGHPKIISTQISEQKILMQFLSHNIPKRNKLAEKISQKTPKLNQTWQGWSLGGSLSKLCPTDLPSI